MTDIEPQIRESFARTGNKQHTADALGLTVSKVKRCLLKNAASPDDTPDETPEARSARLKHLQIEREQLASIGGEKSFRTFLDGLIGRSVQPFPRLAPNVAKRSTKATERHAFLSLNDWHFEEVVKSESVLGLNSYDIPTACRRVYRVIHACREWKRDIEQSGRFRIPELTVALNGDFLTGTLHGLEKHSDAPNVIRAALACGDLIAMALRDLAAEFPRVKVVGTVGNHGRLPDQKKVPTKDPTRSFDYLAYGVARRRLEATKHLTFDTPDSYGALYEIAGHLCYQAHGNFIPQSLGIVGYGIRRFTSSLASNLSAAGKPLKYAFFGHWHQSNSAEFAGVTTFICPSLIGTQEYGFLSGGAMNRAAQTLLIFDRELGHVTTEVLYGDGPGTGTYELEV